MKSRFLESKAVEFELFESMLMEDGEIFLLERHLDRLRRSALYFGFKIPENLPIVSEVFEGKWKVKVSLGRDGRLTREISEVTDQKEIKRVALVAAPVDSSDPFLFHKTTRRDRLKLPVDCDDVIFWNERGEVTESSIANVVVAIGDRLFTPPVSCGLLAGTFRDHLLAQGRIKERVITVEELKSAKEFFLINSVRKWMRAELVIEKDFGASAAKLL